MLDERSNDCEWGAMEMAAQEAAFRGEFNHFRWK